MFDYMKVPFICKSTFEKHQNELLFPVITDAWETEQQQLFQRMKEMDGPALLGGDGRADSPGHCAKYGTYTMMELRLGKVIDVQLVQVRTCNYYKITSKVQNNKRRVIINMFT